jgi:hypothetical protein
MNKQLKTDRPLRDARAQRAVNVQRSAFSVQRSAFSLLAILALALGLRLLLWSQPVHEPANDEVEYIAVARDLLAGRGWAFYDSYRWLRAPLYPLFLAGSLWLSGGGDPASSAHVLHRAALPNIALSVANVFLAYRLTLALFGPDRRVALLAALITAVLWTNVTFASLYMAETLFTFLFQAGLLALVYATKTSVLGTLPCWMGGCGRYPPTSPFSQTLSKDQGPGTKDQESRTWDQRLSAEHRWGLIVAAGVLFGLATLTRSVTLLFLPVLALWLLLQRNTERQSFLQRLRPAKPSFGASLLFLVTTGLVIMPWTVRNTLAYGAPIVVETGLSYNLWAFNEPRESLSEIHRMLEAIPNPVARSEYATERGMERLREDPGIVARKLWPNWVFLARVKPIQDRFLLESYYATVELPLFVTALVFDDLLYVMIVLAATLALVRRPHWLVLAWIGYCVLTMLLTHGEARYRHFLFPVVVPAAAVGLVGVKGWREFFLRGLRPQTPAWLRRRAPGEEVEGGGRPQTPAGLRRRARGGEEGLRPQAPAGLRRRGRGGEGAGEVRPQIAAALHGQVPGEEGEGGLWSETLSGLRSQQRALQQAALVVVLWAVFLWTVGTSYPWDWASENTARGWHTFAGDVHGALGDRDGALRAYEQAIEAHNAPDAWLRLGHARREYGDLAGAAEAYRRAWRREPLYYPASTWYGDAQRELGDGEAARRGFAGSFADARRVTEYAWRELQPAPGSALDVGDGLDYGFLSGVDPAEQIAGATARWTNGHARFRLAAPPGARVLRLRLAAPRPDEQPVTAEVCVAGVCRSLQLDGEWRTYIVPVEIDTSGMLTIALRSDTFRAADGRELGVLVDWIREGHGGHSPP